MIFIISPTTVGLAGRLRGKGSTLTTYKFILFESENTVTMLLWDDPVGDNGTGTYSDKLLDACNKITDDEALLNLFNNMRGKGLYTRDIFSFVEKQADLRILHRNIDKPTADHALSAKVRDVEETLKAYKNIKAQLKKEYLKEVGGRKYKLRKLMSRISKATNKRRNEKEKVFNNKLNHYQTQQDSTRGRNRMRNNSNASTKEKPFVPTLVPERLKEYESLPIFGTPDMLPKKQDPVGPFICDDNIKLDSNETLLLCRDPKYSLMTECEDTEMSVEIERMLCKHRLNEHSTKQRKEKLSKVETICKDVEMGEKKIDYDEIWKQERHRYIYDPFCKEINFNDRRPTDYKMNKRTKLPKPLDIEGEFMCEIRKRSIYKAYERYKALKGVKTKSSGDSEKSKGGRSEDKKDILNLSNNEKKGLKSLLKRVKNDEIVITPTDKSGRFAVLSLEQYVKAGNKHTDKDESISWSRLKYLRNQVNNHVWWISRIMGYSKNTDQDRMNNNLHVSGLDVPEMVILIKDHKKWNKGSGEVLPSRPVVSGNNTINTHLSEIISEIVEPLALESDGMEINSSEEALGLIDSLNTRIKAGTSGENVLNQLCTQNNKMADKMAGVVTRT